MKKMIIILIGLIILLIVASILLAMFFESNYQSGDYKKAKIEILGNEFLADVADSSFKKAKGLGGREKLESGEGMLFVYDNYVKPGFWMKGMKFPIDIIWIKDNKVIGLTENILPESFKRLELFYPPEPVNYVLEIKAGEVERLGIKVGETIKLLFH